MDFTEMIRSPGYIFGPLMILSGIIAFVLCIRATRAGDRKSARQAVLSAASPPFLGVLGAAFGWIVWYTSYRVEDRDANWSALGYTVLFGVLVSAIPAIWSAALLRRSGMSPA